MAQYASITLAQKQIVLLNETIANALDGEECAQLAEALSFESNDYDFHNSDLEDGFHSTQQSYFANDIIYHAIKNGTIATLTEKASERAQPHIGYSKNQLHDSPEALYVKQQMEMASALAAMKTAETNTLVEVAELLGVDESVYSKGPEGILPERILHYAVEHGKMPQLFTTLDAMEPENEIVDTPEVTVNQTNADGPVQAPQRILE